MKRSSGVRLCATAVVSALSFALITGCSDGGSKDSGSSGDGNGSKPAAKALSAAELEKRILAKGDVDGYKVEKAPKAGASKQDDTECAPLERALGGSAPSGAAAEASRLVTQEKKKKNPTDDATSLDDLADGKFEDSLKDSMDVDVTHIGLASYNADGAEKGLKALSDAIKGCTGGFTVSVDGDKMKYTKVETEKTSGTGDDSVAFAATGDSGDGDPGTVHVEVTRHGNTLATYYTINLGALIAKKAYTVPAAVIKAQAAKLK